MNTTNLMNRAADNIRILAASMVEKAKSGHPGGAMGGADFINVLYSEFMEYDPENPGWEARDRFFLDPGHMAPMLYAALCLAGKFSLDDLKRLRQWGSPTPGHPERDIERGIENASGPLGQGHVFGVGAAIAAKFFNQRYGAVHNPTIYAYISDGGIQEEISQGAGRIAGHLGLDNLIMFYDANSVQLSTMCEEVNTEDIRAKYEAWNWYVQDIDGCSAEAIREALNNAKAEKNRPSLIIGRTVMGKGAIREDGTSFEGKCSTHGQPISKAGASFEKTIENLGGNPQDPFVIFPEVRKIYEQRAATLKELANRRYEQYYEWKQTHEEDAREYEAFMSEEVPCIDWSLVHQKRNASTRAASAKVLEMLAQTVGNMVVSSADLCSSDKTDGFLKHTTYFKKGDFSGQFLQPGVSELTLACLMIGMRLHGGIIPSCGTFFVFSDYMKPAARMAALMELPVIYIWSHDSFRVGEDGATHEPIEQEAQIRLMERVRNHSGRPSMLVLRPADAEETTEAWRLAIENTHTPTALILSRQDIDPIHDENTDTHTWAEGFRKGGYIVEKDNKVDVVLIASGSEASLLQKAAALLRKDGIGVQIDSIPSEGLLREQDTEYQKMVLPEGIKRFGLTAGLSCTLESLVGSNGKIFGVDHFGYSAPAEVLEEKFGFTPENIYKQIKEIL